MEAVMAGSVNKVTLIGNLGKDPEIKMTTGGQAVARFSLATTETWKNAQGEKQSKTEWHNVVVWGKLAEICEKYLRKGKQVYIMGRIQSHKYTPKDGGEERTAYEIRCDDMVMLGSKEDSAGGGEGEGYQRKPEATDGNGTSYPAYGAAPAGGGSYPDDDIPF